MRGLEAIPKALILAAMLGLVGSIPQAAAAAPVLPAHIATTCTRTQTGHKHCVQRLEVPVPPTLQRHKVLSITVAFDLKGKLKASETLSSRHPLGKIIMVPRPARLARGAYWVVALAEYALGKLVTFAPVGYKVTH